MMSGLYGLLLGVAIFCAFGWFLGKGIEYCYARKATVPLPEDRPWLTPLPKYHFFLTGAVIGKFDGDCVDRFRECFAREKLALVSQSHNRLMFRRRQPWFGIGLDSLGLRVELSIPEGQQKSLEVSVIFQPGGLLDLDGVLWKITQKIRDRLETFGAGRVQ